MNEALAVAFNDVDFCIRLRAAGWRIIWTPTVELYHRESASVGKHSSPKRAQQFSTEVDMMRRRWGPVLDLVYNVNLSLSEPFSLAFPPRQADRMFVKTTAPVILAVGRHVLWTLNRLSFVLTCQNGPITAARCQGLGDIQQIIDQPTRGANIASQVGAAKEEGSRNVVIDLFSNMVRTAAPNTSGPSAMVNSGKFDHSLKPRIAAGEPRCIDLLVKLRPF